MKLKTNLSYDFRPHFTRRVWIDENVDLFILLNGEKCIIEPTNYHLKLPGNIRYHELSSKEVETQ